MEDDKIRLAVMKNGVSILPHTEVTFKLAEREGGAETWLLDEAVCDDQIVEFDTWLGYERYRLPDTGSHEDGTFKRG